MAFCLMFPCLDSAAQIAVNGVEVFAKMTKSEVIAKFGEPVKYKYYDSQDNGVDEWYYYTESHFHFNNNYFIGFSISDNRFVLTLDGLDRTVVVGDRFSVLAPLDPHYMEWFEKDWYCIVFEDEMVRFLVKNGLIDAIVFSTSSSPE